MRIVHITTYDHGGAGIACLRIHNFLLKKGIDSKVICYKKKTENKQIFQFGASLLKKGLNKLGAKFGEYRKFKIAKKIESNFSESVFFSFPTSDYDLVNHRLVKDADIIHLHWVANYLDYPSFFKKIKKPVVWTFHDSNPILGGFHYPPKTKIPEWVKKNNDEIIAIKAKAYAQCSSLSIVCISTIMLEMVEQCNALSHANKILIYNGVDSNEFCYRNNEQLRKSLLKNKYRKIILFVSKDLNHELKGLHRVLEAYESLERDDVLLLLVGDTNGNEIKCSKEYKHFPATNSCEELSTYYSVADLFVLGSSFESFSQTAIESLMCGTPIVMTPVGVAEDIQEDDGVLILSDFTPSTMANAIVDSLSIDYNRNEIAKDARGRFDINVIGQQILNFYQTKL